MKKEAKTFFLFWVALAVGGAAAGQTYVLDGFRLSGVRGVDQDALVASLKQKRGDHITEAEISADTQALSAMLRARKIDGDLFATIAEKNGRVWVLFDFQYPQVATSNQRRWLGSEAVEGNVRLSEAAVKAAAGLRPGDDLPVERINGARQGILDAYKKAAPGQDVRVGGQVRVTAEGKVALTWRIKEPDK